MPTGTVEITCLNMGGNLAEASTRNYHEGYIELHLADVLKGEALFAVVAVHVQKGQFVRLALGHAVHDVEREVEFVGIGKIDSASKRKSGRLSAGEMRRLLL